MTRRTTILVLAALAITAAPAGAQVFTEKVPILLGRDNNKFSIDQNLYLGADVDRFRITFGFDTGWPTGVTVRLFDRRNRPAGVFTVTAPVALTDSVESLWITGNAVRIQVTSNGRFVDLDANGTRFEIRGVEIGGRTAGAPTFARSMPLELGVETIGFISTANTAQHVYRIDGLTTPVHTFGVYLSPFAEALKHQVTPTLRLQTSAVRPLPPPTTWARTLDPVRGDTGIYEEVSGNARAPRLFLGVDAAVPAFYRLTVQNVREMVSGTGGPLISELDGRLDGLAAPRVAPTPRLADDLALSRTIFSDAYLAVVHAYVADDATYNRRVEEAIVMASASLLAATEGQLRFKRVKQYDSFESTRNVDVQWESSCGRANAWAHAPMGALARIQMWRDQLVDPLGGGRVLLHEWGHYHWAIKDEYIEPGGVGDTVDRNSVMGNQQWSGEFCSSHNHFSRGGVIGPAAAWDNITRASGIRIPRPAVSPTPYPQNQGLYLDVLHRLESLMVFERFRNPSPTGRGIIGACRGFGGACTGDLQCFNGGVCDPTARMCVPPPRGGWAMDFCTAASQCAANLCAAHACADYAVLGGNCATGQVCATNRCDTAVGRCIVNDGAGADGTFCTHNNQCTSRNCFNGTCSAAATAVLGGACASNVGCTSGRCDTAILRCIPNDRTGTAGSFCSRDNQCSTNLCNANRCVAVAPLGAFCGDGRACVSNRCDNAPGNPARCIPNDGHGVRDDYCSHNNQCASRNCALFAGQRFGKCS